MTTDFLETFKLIKSKHDSAYKIVETAIRKEEEENVESALSNYKDGIFLIDEILAIPVSLPQDVKSVETEWNEACKIIHKLKRSRAEILQRIGILSRKLNSSNNSSNASSKVTPTHPELESGRPRTYTELAQALRNIQCGECHLNDLELIFSCDGVKLYHIKSNGEVSTSMHNCVMRIIRMEKDDKNNLAATFFIQIIKSTFALPVKDLEHENDDNYSECKSDTASTSNNLNENILDEEFAAVSNSRFLDNFDGRNNSSWIYPLVAGASPCFRTDYGAFIFPDLESSEPGTSIGIIVPKEDRNDEIVLEILEAILHGVVIQGEEDRKRREAEGKTQEVSESIIRGAEYISQNLIKGAESTGRFISYATPFLISKMKRAPNDAPPVSGGVEKSVKVAKNVTGIAAGATSFIAEKVGSATAALGRFLAPHIQKHGSTLLSKGLGLSEQEAHEKLNGILTIAASAVEGFGTIYSGLEESAKILGKNLGENSTKIIEHKYGSSASNVAAETFDTVGNVINLSQNVNYFTPKGFAKRTVKRTGKAIVQNYRPNIDNNIEISNHQTTTVPVGAIYPNFSLLENEITKRDI